VVVTDGFHTVVADRRVNVVNPLALVGTVPANGESGVRLNAPVQAAFVSRVRKSSLKSDDFSLASASGQVKGTILYDDETRTASLALDQPLVPNSRYTATLAATVEDRDGNRLAQPIQWSFDTEADKTGPYVVNVSPTHSSLDVPVNTLVQVQFNEPLTLSAINTDTFRLLDEQQNPVATTIAYDTIRYAVLLQPQSALTPNTIYQLQVQTSAIDAAGNSLEQPYTSLFTTGSEASNGIRVLGYRDRGDDQFGDARFEDLQVTVDVEILTTAFYNLNARLVDGTGQLIDWTTTGNLLLSGPAIHSLSLVYDGAVIGSSGANGPYLMDALHFYKVDSQRQTFFFRQAAYRTRSYQASDFYSTLDLAKLPEQVGMCQ